MLGANIIKRLSTEERNYVRDGGMFMALFTGGFAYFNYREYIKKDFLRSEAHYRFNSRIQNVTPWKQLYFTWWRMPDEEFNVYHRFKPYFILGQMDYTKEILIPNDKIIGGQKVQGYDVLNPLYCYEGGRLSFQKAFEKKDPITVERAAIVVNRGWIPAELKDKKSRPNEINTRRIVKLKGVFRKGKNIHDYTIPNNPDNNDWHNLCLEDIGIYWDLPNFDEQKFYYFQTVQIDDDYTTEDHNQLFPMAYSADEIVDDHYQWKVDGKTNQKVFQVGAAVAAVSAGIAFLA